MFLNSSGKGSPGEPKDSKGWMIQPGSFCPSLQSYINLVGDLSRDLVVGKSRDKTKDAVRYFQGN
jgi:hypothetical protein